MERCMEIRSVVVVAVVAAAAAAAVVVVGSLNMIVWTPAVLSVLCACVCIFVFAPVQRN